MHVTIRSLACQLTLAVLACNGVANAQGKPAGYPIRPIRLIVSVAPGASADAIARAAVGQMLTDRLGLECRSRQPLTEGSGT